MLRIGLTGGIGAGKSTVSATFSDQGAVVVDGDVISREVVAPGTEGLAALVDAFGSEILLPDGALNRPALAAVAFSDDDKRATLNGIVHPLVAARRAELIAAAPADAVIVEDIPLLVESQMASMFPLVVIVSAHEEVRVARLIEHRGFSDADARARIAAQATEEQRRAVADVWLDNAGSADDLKRRALELWQNRILPFAHNVQVGQTVSPKPELVPHDSTWPDQAQRIVKRIQTACGTQTLRIDHIGSTAVPGLAAKDVIDIQITVASLDVADEIIDALTAVGYLRVGHITTDVPHTADAALWRKRFHGAADPGRPANVHIRVDGWPNQQFALLFRDWLIANPGEQAEYVAVKREALSAPDYAEAKEPWIADAYARAWKWADATSWQP